MLITWTLAIVVLDHNRVVMSTQGREYYYQQTCEQMLARVPRYLPNGDVILSRCLRTVDRSH